MQTLKTIPKFDGFRMPAEYEQHQATVLIWPVRPGSWTNAGKEAKPVFTKIARAIAQGEELLLLADKKHFKEASEIFEQDKNIKVINIDTDDAWARDVGPTCIVNDKGYVRGIDWCFNAWGGEWDGLYASWDLDNAAAGKICQALNLDCYDMQDFVLEGGSIHSDGEGTVLVTEACLLSKGRNPSMTKEQIEEKLKESLGAKKVIWLKNGIAGDETNEHVDNMCAFVGPGEVVLAWTDDPKDLQWAPSHEALETLRESVDAKGRHFKVHKLPIPKKPVCITQEELCSLEFEDGEDKREVGERLAASYVNFYIANSAVLVPQFGDEYDEMAAKLIGSFFPDRKLVKIYARPIIVGGGNIHCITQQIPKGICKN